MGELQGPGAMQTEQSNSQMPVQSSLDVDGGVPYEEKVMAAVAMQHLLSAPERDRDGRGAFCRRSRGTAAHVELGAAVSRMHRRSTST